MKKCALLFSLSAAVVNGLFATVSAKSSAQPASIFAEPRSTVGVDSYPLDVAIGDVTGDDVPDMLVPSDINNFFRVLAGQGNGSFSSHSTHSTAQRPERIRLDDFNNDGNLDAVTTGDVGPDSVSVRLGAGNGSIGRNRHNWKP